MQEVNDQSLKDKINHFINRKAKQYPELRITEHWDEYEYTPTNRVYGKALKFK